MMHPYSQGALAAAQKALAQCEAALKKACEARGPEAWAHIGEAMCAATVAKVKVDDALEIDREMARLEEGTAA